MSKKIKFGGFLGVILLLALAGLTGCGTRSESTYYYYSPSWTVDGNIVFIKGLQVVNKDVVGTQTGSAFTENISTMTAAGASETALYDVTGAPPYAMTCAPVGTYVAFATQVSGSLYGNIIIQNISSATHRGLDRVELKFSPGIVSFDWSDDAKKLVYCTATEIHTVNIDGTGDTTVLTGTDLTFVTWKYGARIAYTHTVSGNTVLSFVRADGTNQADMTAAASVDRPQISAVNTNLVYGIGGGSYCSVDTSVGTPATTEVLASFRGQLPRLNPAANKVTYSKTGQQSGIYLLDLTTKAETTVK
jgi:hypothetical protein